MISVTGNDTRRLRAGVPSCSLCSSRDEVSVHSRCHAVDAMYASCHLKHVKAVSHASGAALTTSLGVRLQVSLIGSATCRRFSFTGLRSLWLLFVVVLLSFAGTLGPVMGQTDQGIDIYQASVPDSPVLHGGPWLLAMGTACPARSDERRPPAARLCPSVTRGLERLVEDK